MRLVTARLIARGLKPYLCIVLDVQRVRDQSNRLALEQDLEYISVVHFPLYNFATRCVIPCCTVVDQPKAGVGVGSGIEVAIRFGGVDRAD